MELSTEIITLQPYLFRIAYNMLGVVEDAEDVVHDVYEKWVSVNEVREPKAYLGRMVVNQSIKRLEEQKKHRESYTGPWLPEPYITLDPDPLPTIEYGLLFLMERLNPLERAVFILRESFSEEYSNIAELLGISADNCRQLLHRAHEKLERKTIQTIDPIKHRKLTEAFVRSLLKEDRSSLEHLLRNDVELYGDGGGKRAAALKPIFGFSKVLKFLIGVKNLPENQGDIFEYKPGFINGVPAMLIFRRSNGELDAAQYVVMENDNITQLLFMRNPDKLKVR